MNKIFVELYRLFFRVVVFVFIVEVNICCEELCFRIFFVDEDWKNKVDINVVDMNKL